jgi:hypothetical protein
MRLTILFPVIFALAKAQGQGQPAGAKEAVSALERRIADHQTRATAIAECASDLNRCESWLLAIAAKPPGEFDVGEDSVAVGLADAFGALRMPAGIPFLIENITLTRDRRDQWRYVGLSDFELRLPAVGALIKIGAPAGEAVASHRRDPSTRAERFAATYVVSELAKAGAVMPSAPLFLAIIARDAGRERDLAGKGLESLKAREAGGRQGENPRPK